MLSQEEILATVCRVIKNNIINPPEKLDANTRIVALKYIKEGNPNPTVYCLTYDVIREFQYSGHVRNPWAFPDYFDYDKTSKKLQSIGDFCQLIQDGFDAFIQGQKEAQESKNREKNLRETLKDVPLVDLDELLNGKPTWETVQKYFLDGDFDDERYLIDAIKLHLRTPKQKTTLDKLDLSIADILNGRCGDSNKIDNIFKEWNKKLGFDSFGS